MLPIRFDKSFTQQEAIPEDSIAAAIEVMRSGRLHRYNVAPGEESQVAALEREVAAWQGSRYALACSSGGAALRIALRAAGIGVGDVVLTNGFTLAPVPGAIVAVGARPVLVEITEDLRLDLDDLQRQIARHRPAAVMASHMRGHLCDMDLLTRICADAGVLLIEDCAHTMGARWNGRRSGSFGLAGAFSSQTYKHLNSGEGGLLVSDDPDFMARAIILSGSYMLYGRHGAAPKEQYFERVRLKMPNLSARMDNLRAAILRPQLVEIEDALRRWNERYRAVSEILDSCRAIMLPRRPAAEAFVGSSIQFRLPEICGEVARKIVADAADLGVELKWFGAAEPVGFTSAHPSWQYMETQELPRTDAVMAGLFDMRLPLTFEVEDCRQIGQIIVACVRRHLPDCG
ncbi:DegT/DnrJ/EryC1/StrS family aminotransferase [Paracoccus sp. Z330]|uniref:DegT/DnrJ/EryC1/StrS family aminotransferase n=1 Tax=Paracoccus onchidii TaxID=3017813 RepID=A0ABT4ZHC4_9RHOB|nr:DegT/DnrJ/EryC1/StrS family aminotransferase [Paracoccus onchidii]MDB6178730.1 DegT/DnrJ/EryC1/StrS family aminotransferase [Paracoccus onchidii]